MKERQSRLKGAEEQKRIEGKRVNFYDYEYSDNRRNILKKWYVVYMTTTLLTVVVVTMLLVFGIGSGNKALAENISLKKIAESISDFFVSIDFGSRHEKATDDGGFIAITDSSESGTSTDEESHKPNNNPSTDVGAEFGGLYDYDYSVVPEGYTPIIPMDLSLSSYGERYINNSTGYSPDIYYLLNKKLNGNGGYEFLSVSSKPQVLIVHTHGTEAYSKDGALYCEDDGDYARTSDTQKNVVAVGKTIADILNKNGIPTVHCTIMHDSVQYKDSYARAEETIKTYLEEYPTIKLVIDVHRDSIIKSSGEIVRPVAELDGEAAAQIMCVVGSDWAGDDCPDWENNLSLALKLRSSLNSQCENICRPVFLKPNTYNQELAPFSLLLEVGASGNSLEEAQRSAELIGKSLVTLVQEI